MKFFTNEEIRDLIIAILALALIFAYPDLKGLFFISLIVVIISFLLHEMGHKFLASRLGCTATFKILPVGILLGFVSMFLKSSIGFIFFAPGFVEILPYKFGRWGIKVIRLTPRYLGFITLAGVGINLFFAFFFMLFPGEIFQILSQINILLAFFNLIPIPPFDGSKIFLWSIWFWVFLFLLSIFGLIILL